MQQGKQTDRKYIINERHLEIRTYREDVCTRTKIVQIEIRTDWRKKTDLITDYYIIYFEYQYNYTSTIP